MDYNATLNRLDGQPVYNELPDSKAVEAVQEVLKHPGLYHLWGLMLGSRQTHFMMLSEAPAGNLDQVRRLGVIQRTIKGIELFRQTVLEQTIASGESKEGAQG